MKRSSRRFAKKVLKLLSVYKPATALKILTRLTRDPHVLEYIIDHLREQTQTIHKKPILTEENGVLHISGSAVTLTPTNPGERIRVSIQMQNSISFEILKRLEDKRVDCIPPDWVGKTVCFKVYVGDEKTFEDGEEVFRVAYVEWIYGRFQVLLETTIMKGGAHTYIAAF